LDDRQDLTVEGCAIGAAVAMCGRRDRNLVRSARIEDTLFLDRLMVTPALLPKVERDAQQKSAGDRSPWSSQATCRHGHALVPAG
jgi:hypothetical protein